MHRADHKNDPHHGTFTLPFAGQRPRSVASDEILYPTMPYYLKTMPQAVRTSHKLTAVQWVICVMAAIGFAFDTYALLVLPLIVRPALMDLAKVKPGTPDFNYWVGLLFYIPAVAGGIFGLLGGYLTDRLGRRRILVWSILLYAFSALASGFATSAGMLLLLRCTTFIGVSVEFVAAVAWLAELFPDPKQRESVLGYSSVAEYSGAPTLTERKEWKFFAVLPKADPGLAAAWWTACC
jgi:hypothetical protein